MPKHLFVTIEGRQRTITSRVFVGLIKAEDAGESR